jgi:hypothetical protein
MCKRCQGLKNALCVPDSTNSSRCIVCPVDRKKCEEFGVKTGSTGVTQQFEASGLPSRLRVLKLRFRRLSSYPRSRPRLSKSPRSRKSRPIHRQCLHHLLLHPRVLFLLNLHRCCLLLHLLLNFLTIGFLPLDPSSFLLTSFLLVICLQSILICDPSLCICDKPLRPMYFMTSEPLSAKNLFVVVATFRNSLYP